MPTYTLIFRTNEWDDDIANLAERAQRCCGSGKFIIAADESERTLIVAPYPKLSHNSDFSFIGLPNIPRDRVLWWNGDAVLYTARRALPYTDYYIMSAHTVFFSCELDDVIRRIADEGIDLAASKIEPLSEIHWSRTSIRGITSDPYQASMPLVILSGRAVDYLLKTRQELAARLESGQIEHWPYWEAFIPTMLLQHHDMSVSDLNRFVNSELIHCPTIMSLRDPRLSKAGIVAHPVMSGFRFVRAFMASEPIPRSELWYEIPEEFSVAVHALLAAHGVHNKGAPDHPYTLDHFRMDLSSLRTSNLAVVLDDPASQELFVKSVIAVVREKVFGSRMETVNANIDHLQFLAAGIDSSQYAIEHMGSAQRFDNSDLLRDHATGSAPSFGMILEFGVFAGHTINRLAAKLSDRHIYGFDSFEGLPEAWGPGAPKGTFKLTGVPTVRENVELIVGWFDQTLPQFLEQHPNDPVTLLHIDCDLYSSTKTVLSLLSPRIVTGTLIIFDEYFNYPGWRHHEFKAFQEFVTARNLKYEYVGMVPSQEQVLVRIV